MRRPLEIALGVFGEKLRKQREQRGISLDAISTTTKISPRMLRAIEDEHFDQLPGGVFNKGFVRAYARQVGLDEEEAISDYLAALRESQIQSRPTLPHIRNTNNTETEEIEATYHHPEQDLARPSAQKDNGGAGRLGRSATGAATDSLGDHGLINRRKQSRRAEDRIEDTDADATTAYRPKPVEAGRDEPVASAPLSFLNLTSESPSLSRTHSPSPNPSPRYVQPSAADRPPRNVPWKKLAVALLVITLGVALWNLRRHRQAATPANSSVAAATSPAPPVPSTVTATPPLVSTKANLVTLPPALKHSSSASEQTNTPMPVPPASDLNPPVEKPRARETTAARPVTFTLQIRADQTSWISASADGQLVAQETLIAPAHTSIRAGREIVVRVGNAAGITFVLNGKEIPAGGNLGEVRTYTFNADGLHLSGTQ